MWLTEVRTSRSSTIVRTSVLDTALRAALYSFLDSRLDQAVSRNSCVNVAIIVYVLVLSINLSILLIKELTLHIFILASNKNKTFKTTQRIKMADKIKDAAMKKLQEGAHFHSSSDMNADMSTEAADMVVLAVDKYIPTQNWEVRKHLFYLLQY